MENHFEPHFTNDQLRSISSIGLAHMGDAVFEVLVREWLCASRQGYRQRPPSGHNPAGMCRVPGRKGKKYSAAVDRGRGGGL